MRWVLAVLALASCEPESTLLEVDCDTAPLVTWETFGRGFLTQHCQPCHSSTSADRHDAPNDVTFDTLDDVVFWESTIEVVAASADPIMPPQGGVSADDRELLAIWLQCYGAAGP